MQTIASSESAERGSRGATIKIAVVGCPNVLCGPRVAECGATPSDMRRDRWIFEIEPT